MTVKQRLKDIEVLMDELLDEMDGKHHVSEREELEELRGEYGNLEAEMLDLNETMVLMTIGNHFGFTSELTEKIMTTVSAYGLEAGDK